jgi:putative beta-lysine N-acetyltransferase
MAKYRDAFRARKSHPELISQVIDTANKAEPIKAAAPHPGREFHYGLLTPKDVREMAAVYKTVFETYPFPIHDPDYLASTMQDNFVYFGIREKDRLIAISSCEMDARAKNVEMTDFDTLPEYRSKGLASFLLMKMEEEMRRRGIITAYTIARAESYGMNIVFSKHGYAYAGTLVKNTNISKGIESMNVWYKAL